MRRAGVPAVDRLRPVSVQDWLAPVCFGGLVYLLWRSSNLTMFTWLQAIGGAEVVAEIRLLASPLILEIPRWILFSLPAALWSYSIVAWVAWSWRDVSASEASAWIAGAALLGPVSELLQGFGVVPGTFDWVDLYSYTAANALALARVTRGGVHVA